MWHYTEDSCRTIVAADRNIQHTKPIHKTKIQSPRVSKDTSLGSLSQELELPLKLLRCPTTYQVIEIIRFDDKPLLSSSL
jgi:hypothetical protein